MPRQQANSTYICELEAVKSEKDNSMVPQRRFTDEKQETDHISQPPIQNTDAPVYPHDHRCFGFGLARRNELEQYQVECNELTTSLLRCNTSMQPLISPSQAKSASFYAANYISKDPFELSACLPLLYQGQLELRKYGSTAKDSGSSSRNTKALLEKLLHKVNKIEVSAQQAASAMLGYDSFFSSHDFQYCFIWDAVKRFNEIQKYHTSNDNIDGSESSGEDDESNTELDEEDIDETESRSKQRNQKRNIGLQSKFAVNKKGQVITQNQFIQYAHRGEQLKRYSLYDYTAIVRHKRGVRDKQNENSKRGRGRPSSKIYKYEGSEDTGCPDKTFGQTIQQKLTIPILPGAAPPAYPGDKPVESQFISKSKQGLSDRAESSTYQRSMAE